MSDIAIKLEGIGKQYFIGGPQKVHDNLSDLVFEIFKSPIRRASKLMRGQASGAAELDEKFWALKDISVEIGHGEIIGVIGRNGSGKSTLLKILSRITEPTEGYADIFGRVGSLLEVGTGFHPELTGRENVYLNGAILGMKKEEIEHKFDEIVAFAEIDRFIDTPVKHYSSGMYVRLAFSVAAHLEPEILLVDEVLAVGDVAFQRKCLGKMDDIGRRGRTILFVSHNMGLIQKLCSRGVLLNEGQVSAIGPVGDVIDAYLRTMERMEAVNVSDRTDRRGSGQGKLVGVEVQGSFIGSSSILKTGQPARFILQVDRMLPGMACAFGLFDYLGVPVIQFNSKMSSPNDTQSADMDLKFVCEVDELPLLPGRYRMDVWIDGDNEFQDFVQAAIFFDVEEGDIRGRLAQPHKRFRITMPHRWILPRKK